MKPFKNFESFLNVSQKFVFFVQTLERLTHTLLIFFEKYAKTMHFRNFLMKPFKNFECFLNVSQKFVFFVQTLEKLTHLC